MGDWEVAETRAAVVPTNTNDRMSSTDTRVL